MNPTHYFGIMIRLFAIAFFVFGISKLEYVVTYASYNENIIVPSIVFSLLSSVLPILISFLIWFFPLTIAKKILPPVSEEIESISSTSMLTVFLLAIGIYSLYFAINDGIYWLTLIHIFGREEYSSISRPISFEDRAAILSTIIEFLIAVIIIAKAKTISRFLISFAK